MSETRRTLLFCGVALVLVVLAALTAPRRVTPDAFLDQGEAFFPDFTDPNAARTLEVIDFDEETGAAKPFKVTFSGGRWTIPSHHNHPADGAERLAKTAAGVIGIRKDDFRSDNVSDHAACGVLDPLDDTAVTLEGRGQRVTIKGENDVILADFIIGKPIENREGFRFVRVPGQKRVYAVRMDIDISTTFNDWIEADLLNVDKNAIEQVTLHDYSINESTRKLDERDVLVLDKNGSTWSADGMGANEEVDMTQMNKLLSALDELTIVGVRPKPEGLSASLTRSTSGVTITSSDQMSLQSKGYFFTSDGRLVSNEGEMQVRTTDGVAYTLRFGEVVYGSGTAVTAGTGSGEAKDEGPGLNRYLFITTSFDPEYFPEPPAPANLDFQSKADTLWTSDDYKNRDLHDAHERWRGQVENGRKISDDLNARFAAWYYVISSESFDKLRLTRAEILKTKEEN